MVFSEMSPMPHRFVWKRFVDFFMHRVVHVQDTPHRIALGVAIGIFVAWTPTVGFQMALAVALAWLLGANKLVGVPFVWISSPLTFVPIYLPNYYVGRWILGSDVPPPDFGKLADVTGGRLEWATTWWAVTWNAILPLWVGSLLVAFVLAVPTYLTTYYAVVLFRQKRHASGMHPPRGTRDGDSDGQRSEADASRQD
jgi:uncharacterized protein